MIKTCGMCNWYESRGKYKGICTLMYSIKYNQNIDPTDDACRLFMRKKHNGGANE